MTDIGSTAAVIYRNTGFGLVWQSTLAAAGARRVRFVDVDEDGDRDAAIAAAGATIFRNLGGGASWSSAAHVPFASGATDLAEIDVVGDGVPELALARWSPRDVVILASNGADTVASCSSIVEGGPAEFDVADGDLNGDGRPDLVVTQSNLADGIHVLLGNGGGSFGPPVHYAMPGAYRVVLADVSSDRKLDVLVAGNDGRLRVMLGDGAGGFGPVATFNAGFEATRLAVGDLNGDGRADVALGGGGWISAWLLFGDGAGGFAPAVAVDSGGYTDGVAIADMNADGIADLVCANASTPTFWNSSVSVLLGTGGGAFAPPQSHLDVFTIRNLAVGDVNADGKLDVVAGRYSAPSLLFLGTGTGALSPMGAIPATGGSDTQKLTDVNGDGKLDLVVSDSIAPSIRLLLGGGDGTFQPPQVMGHTAHVRFRRGRGNGE